MALMLGSLYDALKAAGAPDDQAREAAEEVAGFDTRLHRIESGLATVRWMVGFMLALQVAALAIMAGGFWTLWSEIAGSG